MYKFKTILFLAWFVCCIPSPAQEFPQRMVISSGQLPPLSLMDAITEGLEKNYSIILARNSEQVSSNNATYGNAGMLPQVTLNGALGGNHVKTFGQDGVAGAATWNTNVAMDWTVFDGMAMFANHDRLQELKLMGREELRLSVQQTAAEIMNVYFDIVSRQQELRATRRILRISRLRMRSANDRFHGGSVSKVDILSAQVDYNADTASYIQQTEGLRKAKIILNNLLAREITTNFRASDTIRIDQSLNYGRIHDMALAENPDVVLSRMAVNVAAFTLKATEGSQYPTVRLTSNYALAGRTDNSETGALNYGLSVSMPLFDGLNARRQIRNARLGKDAADIRYEQVRKDIEAQVAAAYSTYEVNRTLAAFEASNLNLAEENLNISMDRYRLGAISAVELRDVQRSFISATNRLIVATYNAKIAETALKSLTGEVIRLE
jgi:outer membrane protein TolC